MNGAQLLSKTLVNEDIEFIFTTSNNQMEVLYDATKEEDSLKIITAESGASAASMADAYTRLTGKTGVVFSATRAEALWVATGVASAWGDKIPMVSIAAHEHNGKICTSLEDLKGGYLEELFHPITKWNAVIRQWEKIPLMIQRGIQEARTGTPGPVHLDIPGELLFESRKITGDELAQMLPRSGRTRFEGKTRGDAAKIREAIELLIEAKKPFVLAGGGVLASEAWKELLELVEYLNIPVCVSMRAAGIIPYEHPCYIGAPTFGAGLSFHKAILHSDVVLAIGCAFSELEGFGQPPFWSPDIRFIHVDINPLQIGKNTNVEVAINGYYRVSGKPAVVLSAVGTGVINEIPPTATAFKDNIPIISITSTVQSWKMDPIQENLHGCEQWDLLATVTKWNVVIRHWERIPELIQYGFREALTGSRGPVHIDINFDVLFGSKWISKRALNKMIQNPENTRFTGEIRGDEAMIEEAVQLLLKAEKPLIISGGEVTERKAWAELQEFADYLKIPVLTTKRGIGTISTDHKCYVGGLNYIVDKDMRNLLLQSDIVLSMGCDLSEFRGKNDIKIIQVDIEPSCIGVNNIEIAIIGDAKSVLRDMLSCAKEFSSGIVQETPWMKQLNETKTAWLKRMNEEINRDSTSIHPGFLAKEIKGLLKEDAVIIYDGKLTAFWGELFCPPRLPSAGFFPCDMNVGAGLPMALGAQLASPERQVCTFIEGKSFLYSVRELETAKRYNLPILTIILNDTVSQNRDKDLRDIDYAKIARSFKCFGERIKDRKEVKGAFLRAIESGLPAVLDVLVSPGIQS